ncbi:LuxR C-terminal-related transcriptional regulator [Crenothrix sp.]|uniref:LuxR C-terminal-related transcriptional regulator n=1 Tax=Crenothrix sp. TaxID=3100433 RepID=UPI00374D2E9B
MTLKILRALKDVPLSSTPKEVALLLAQNCSNEMICQRLHIKLTTTKDHIRKIFSKLSIHSREELLPLLLALEKS